MSKWKAFLNVVLEGLVMCDPVAYIYYMEYKQMAEREAKLQVELQAEEMRYRVSRRYAFRPIDGSLGRAEETLA
jgi:hypothetical protein